MQAHGYWGTNEVPTAVRVHVHTCTRVLLPGVNT